jgi:hypothetical protein
MIYKYKTRFFSVVSASLNFEEDFNISKASLMSLKDLIPKNINLEKNIDLIGTAFNATVVNRVNFNHDCIDSKTAVAVAEYFVHKPTNIEHKTKRVVGHIVNQGFSSFPGNEILTLEEIAEMEDPFNLSLAAVVYKMVEKDFANLLLDSADESSPNFHKVSASWEVGFNDFDIVLGSRDLKDAEIISDKKHIEELKSSLKAYGGRGERSDGTPIYRLLKGTVYPLGIGYTSNPAAEVQGLVVDDSNDLNEEIDEEQEIDSYSINISPKTDKKISHTDRNPVKTTKLSTMDLEKLTKALDTALAELKASTSQIDEKCIANLSAAISDKIRVHSDQFQKEVEQAKKAEAEALQLSESLKASVLEIETKLKQAESKIVGLEDSIAAQEQEEVFNVRMASIDNDFDLEDADRKIISSELKTVETSEEAFASYQEKLNVLFKHKNKAYKAEQEKIFQEKLAAEVEKHIAKNSEVSKASKTEDVKVESGVEASEGIDIEQALANAESEGGGVASSLSSWKERLNKAFKKEDIEIQL